MSLIYLHVDDFEMNFRSRFLKLPAQAISGRLSNIRPIGPVSTFDVSENTTLIS